MRTGRGGDVEVAVLRHAFEASGLTAPGLARRLGWKRQQTRRRRLVDGSLGKPYTVSWADGTRVRHLMEQETCEASVGLTVGAALGIEVELPPTDQKHCSKCNLDRPLSEFQRAPQGKLGRKAVCPTCCSADGLERYHKSGERGRVVNAVGQSLRRSAQRRVDRQELVEWSAILRGDPCGYCGVRPAGTLDHIDPIKAKGQTVVANLGGACLSCNSRKHDHPLLIALAKGVMTSL